VLGQQGGRTAGTNAGCSFSGSSRSSGSSRPWQRQPQFCSAGQGPPTGAVLMGRIVMVSAHPDWPGREAMRYETSCLLQHTYRLGAPPAKLRSTVLRFTRSRTRA